MIYDNSSEELLFFHVMPQNNSNCGTSRGKQLAQTQYKPEQTADVSVNVIQRSLSHEWDLILDTSVQEKGLVFRQNASVFT